MSQSSQQYPLRPIRRFDVFAEIKRLEALEHGEPEDVARGYGVRIAKIVASKRFGGAAKHEGDTGSPRSGPQPTPEGNRFREVDGSKFRAVDGELQTDQTFEHAIIDRMGSPFYYDVFQPAITEALAKGETYEQIRDAIRADWKPPRAIIREKTAPSG